MSICFVNYCQDKEGGTRWGQWRVRQTEEALRFGADEVRNWCQDDLLDTVFYQLYQDDFQHERGAGLTIWRPYILFQSLLETKCDVLMYIDCDLRIVRHLNTFTNYTEEQDVVAVGSRWLNGEFTKREVLLRMGVDNEEYYNLPQLYGGLIAFKKSELSLKFRHPATPYELHAPTAQCCLYILGEWVLALADQIFDSPLGHSRAGW